MMYFRLDLRDWVPAKGIDRGVLTHGRNTHKRRTHTCVQSPRETLPGNRLAHYIHGTAINTLLRGLQPHFHKVEWVPHDDGAYTAYAACDERAEGLERVLGRGFDILFQLFF